MNLSNAFFVVKGCKYLDEQGEWTDELKSARIFDAFEASKTATKIGAEWSSIKYLLFLRMGELINGKE